MKKLKLISLSMLLVSFFIWGAHTHAAEYITDPSELPKADAYKAIVKINTLAEGVQYNLVHVSSGSGVIIDPSGIILTNYHVVTIMDEFEEEEDETTWQICLTESIGTEADCSYTAKLIAKDKDKDLALLKIVNIPELSSKSSNFNYLDVAATDATNVNDELIAMGYPGIGGDTITITKGIVSGKETKYSNNWIKTDAVISFGSSGGAAINMDGKIVGISTQVHSDLAGTVGYLINSNSIYDWIQTYKAVKSQENGLMNKIQTFTVAQNDLEDSNTFSNDYFEITKPADWDFYFSNEHQLGIKKSGDDDGGYISIALNRFPHKTNLAEIDAMVKENALSAGALTVLNINKEENITRNGFAGKKFTYSVLGDTASLTYFPTSNYIITINYDYGLSDKDESAVENILNSIKVKQPNSDNPSLTSYTNSNPQFSLSEANNWKIMTSKSKADPVDLYNTSYPEAILSVDVEKVDSDVKSFNNKEYLDYMIDLFNSVKSVGATLDLDVTITESNAHYKLNDQIDDAILFETAISKLSSGEIMVQMRDILVRSGDKYIDISFNMFTDDVAKFEQALSGAEAVLKSLSLSTSPYSGTQTPTNTQTQNQQQTGNQQQAQQQTQQPTPTATGPLATRLRGRILLQVQQHGEAWYVKPDDGQRVYMKDGATAYQMMRGLGLGITDENLAKIPVGIETRFAEQDTDGDGLGDKLEEGLKTDPYNPDSDGDGHSDGTEVLNGYNPLGSGAMNYDYNLGQQVKGKILLQVESRGEAWYINPEDGKRYYMSDGEAAYQIMRYLSLGITDNDLEQIPSTEL